MKAFILSICLLSSFSANVVEAARPELSVTIPYMERASAHLVYAESLLNVALALSEDKYGPYKIVQQEQQTVIRRQLLELEKGDSLSVAVSMPTTEWMVRARVVQFPIMKGLPSYRMFFAHEKNRESINKIATLDALRELKIGQGQGWSTGKILEANGFQVVYGGPYKTLIPMLTSDRFQLLMRGVYEMEPEAEAYQDVMPELGMVDGIAVYTYLPMYFFVSKKQPQLAMRIEYGLKKAHANGQLDVMLEKYFSGSLSLLHAKQRKVFYLNNANINATFFEHDKPYLLPAISKLEAERSF